MNLFIVESPAKINKICAALGKTYTGLASYGHIMDLDNSNMSIDFDNNFNPIYVISADKKTVVSNLAKAAKSAKQVFLATDKDREGEMISWNIAQVLKLKNPKRITFTSLTKAALQDAIKNAGLIDENMVNSQKARRVLDRIVGYELSPLIDKFMGDRKLSAGRVQSVVCRLIVDRENEINNFFSNDNLNSYFQFNAIFSIKKQELKAQLYTKKLPLTSQPFKGEISKIATKLDATNLLTSIIESIFTIENVFTKRRIQSPSTPYTTSTLQQDASNKLGFNSKRTMFAAQHLYEAGLITYMRTDSIILSDEALKNIEKYILETYPEVYYKKNVYKSNDDAQEAHECIRPTDVFTNSITEGGKIQQDEIKLYNLIWKRTVATQMRPAEYDDLNIQISISKLNKYFFGTCISSIVFDGFLIIYKAKNNTENEEEKDEDGETNNDNEKFNVKLLVKDTKLNILNINAKQEYEKPPSRYNEASLINKLDVKNLNIGRPSTYATIMSKIVEKKYVKIDSNPGLDVNSFILSWNHTDTEIKEETKKITLCKEKNKFMPTKLGIVITNYLILNFPKIMEYKFTSSMEQKLDEIASGKLIWHEVIREFYEEFHPLVMNIVNLNNIKHYKQESLGKYLNGDIYASETKYGPSIKYVDGTVVKFFKIIEPLTVETITIDQAINIIKENIDYPKYIGMLERKKIMLKKNGNSYYIDYNKKTYPSTKNNLTLNEAVKIVESGGKTPLLQLKNDARICSIYQGKENRYITVLNTKTNKSYNVPLPDGENLKDLTMERINSIINAKYNKK